MGRLARLVRILLLKLGLSETTDCYVCVSSGTAEMRAAWFLLTALGVLPAKLLQVGTPARPLFGEANVKEVRMDASDWPTIRQLAMPYEYFRDQLRESFTQPGPTPTARGRGRIPSWLQRGTKQVDTKKVEGESKAGEKTFGFDKAFVERMRMLYGDPLTEFLLPILRNKLMSKNLSPYVVQTLTDETFGKLEVFLRKPGLLAPEHFGVFANSICNTVLLEYYQAASASLEIEKSLYEAPDVLNELKVTPEQLEALRQGMPAEPALEAAGEDVEELVSSGSRGPETLEAQNRAVEGLPAEGAPIEAGEETKEIGDRGLETPESQNAATEEAPAQEASPEAGEEREERFVGEGGRHVPGLDDALQELGIYVGSAVLRDAAERAGIAAGSHLAVLLLGETGVGKERFAHLIHRMSPRGSRDLVAVNCAAIPESIAESYLFGHVKGAFSGATSDKKGMFESADHSTLFLDEVTELSLEVQAKLLRVIQDGVVQRLGSTAPRKVDVRIITASNRDLRSEMFAKRFREDLYFRLEVVQIKLPALRERRSEIPELALALLRQINLRRHKPRQLSSAALMRLEKYDWPGNVRQLSNVLERSVLYARYEAIDADDLLIPDDHNKDPFTALPEPSDGFKVEEYLAQVRNLLFLRALEACKGNQTAAAERLGVSKQAVSKFVQGQNDKQN
jgi:DNA-binding NtrC family response regulator